jgi:preprotein translocase subunit SecG
MKSVSILLKKYHYVVAGLLLASMLIMGIGSMRGDSAIVDEIAHIPAGYSYVTKQDYRLNPEHPPLMKDLAGLSLLPLNTRFPDDIQAWTKDVNGQWESGWHFLYHDGNNADSILFWARLPILLFAIAFGAVLYVIARRLLGTAAALVVLALYSFDPNILAHARFVTTDVGAAATMFVAITSFYFWLRRPTPKRLALATALFALAQVTKFSAILLAPFFLGLIIWALLTKQNGKKWQELWRTYAVGYILLGLGSVILIWLFYIPHVLHMSKEVQDALIRGSLTNDLQKPLIGLLTAMNGNVITRALAQYILGLVMVFTRVAGGNTTYFLGEVTNQSFKWYFPVTYLIKTPLPILIAIITSFGLGIWGLAKTGFRKIFTRFSAYSRRHGLEVIGLFFIAFYSFISITGNLNLGIRHLMPILPFVCFVIGSAGTRLVRHLHNRYFTAGAIALLAAYMLTTIIAYPSFVSYFSPIIGGGGNASKYVSDSSVDWGQDFKRLQTYIEAHPEMGVVNLDYFGGAEPRYYMCNRIFDQAGNLIRSAKGYDCTGARIKDWHANYGLPHGYLALSETYLANDRWGAKLRGDKGYADLYKMQPVTKIGNSIYIFKLP